MAQKAGDDNSTSVVWLQLYTVRALVARELQITPLEAEELILEYARRGHFRGCRGSGSYIDPRHWGACNPELGVYVPVDFNRGVVKHICLPATEATQYTLRLRLDDLLEPYERSNTEMREACLARDDVFSMLRELEVPPERAQVDEPSTSKKVEESASKSASAGAPKEKSKLPKEETADIRPKDWLFREFDRVACPVDGQAEYLHGVHERINKDKSVQGRPVKLKTIQNRYAEWKKLPKRRPK